MNKKNILTLILMMGLINSTNFNASELELNDILTSDNNFGTQNIASGDNELLTVTTDGDDFLIATDHSVEGYMVYRLYTDGTPPKEEYSGGGGGQSVGSKFVKTNDGQIANSYATCYGDSKGSSIGYIIRGTGDGGMSTGGQACEKGTAAQNARFAQIAPLNNNTFISLGTSYNSTSLEEYTFSATESSGYPEHKKNLLDSEGYNYFEVKFLTPIADGTFKAGVKVSVNADGYDAKYLILTLDNDGDLTNTQELGEQYAVYDLVDDQATGGYIAPYSEFDGTGYKCGLLQVDDSLNITGKIDLFTTSDESEAASLLVTTTATNYSVVQKDIDSGYYWSIAPNGAITNTILATAGVQWSAVLEDSDKEEKYFFTDTFGHLEYSIIDGHAPSVAQKPVINIGLNATNPTKEDYKKALVEAGLNDVNPFYEDLGDITSVEDITYTIIDDSAIDTSEPGTYMTNISLTDEVGNSSIIEVDVTVHGLPTITADVAAATDETDGTEISDTDIINLFSISAVDDIGTDISDNITVDASSVSDFSKAGVYPLTIEVTDSWGSSQTKDVSLTLTDLVPIITAESTEHDAVIGIPIEASTYADIFGIAAVEPTTPELDITDKITYSVTDSAGTTISDVDYSTVGDYTINFDVVDNDGTVAEPITVVMSVLDVTSYLEVDPTAIIDEEDLYTDDQLIDLFNVVDKTGDGITVDQTDVDYTTPGDYIVVFTHESGSSITSTLTINDILPEITSTTDTATIKLGDTVDDYITLYGVSATEIEEGDLTSSISVDSSKVNFTTTGTYPVEFVVSDNEGNEAIENVQAVVDNDSELKPTTDDADDKNNEESTGLDENYGLATTGSSIAIELLILIIISIGLIGAKLFLTRK